MKIFLFVMLFLNFFFCFQIYRKLRRSSKLFSDRYGMVICNTASLTFGLVLGMILYLLVPIDLAINSLFAVSVTGTIGILFGSLVKFHTLLAGFFGGMISGIMGTMLGAIIKDPSLCSLPPAYLNSVSENIIYFSVFGTILSIITFILLLFSLRV